MGDFDGAKKYYERALEIREKEYSPDHPNVATIVSNLGTVLEDMGDLAGAKEHYERALVINVNHLGEDHPDTKNVRKLMESLQRKLLHDHDLAADPARLGDPVELHPRKGVD
jgi:tetratricopeptide (TPR) repeat protein